MTGSTAPPPTAVPPAPELSAAISHAAEAAGSHRGTPPASVARERPATDRAYDYTKDGITSGLLRGGDLISEGDVAQALQISRTPVREAFLRLAAEGLLRLYPKRGALIVPVTPGEVSDVLVARQLLEPWAVGLVATLPTARRETLAAVLEELIGLQRQAMVDERITEFHVADCDFHLAVVEATGNELLAHFYQSLRDRQLRMLDTATVQDPGRRATVLGQHAGLIQAIRDGEVSGAVAAITAHLGGTAQAMASNGHAALDPAGMVQAGMVQGTTRSA